MRNGGTGGGSRGKEGTYRNKFPVPASRTLLERRGGQEKEEDREMENRSTRRGNKPTVEELDTQEKRL